MEAYGHPAAAAADSSCAAAVPAGMVTSGEGGCGSGAPACGPRLPRGIAKATVKERIRAIATYMGVRGWVLTASEWCECGCVWALCAVYVSGRLKEQRAAQSGRHLRMCWCLRTLMAGSQP
jgi:hypothetical protein